MGTAPYRRNCMGGMGRRTGSPRRARWGDRPVLFLGIRLGLDGANSVYWETIKERPRVMVPSFAIVMTILLQMLCNLSIRWHTTL
jgi:hypothetical protein